MSPMQSPSAEACLGRRRASDGTAKVGSQDMNAVLNVKFVFPPPVRKKKEKKRKKTCLTVHVQFFVPSFHRWAPDVGGV